MINPKQRNRHEQDLQMAKSQEACAWHLGTAKKYLFICSFIQAQDSHKVSSLIKPSKEEDIINMQVNIYF